MTRAIDSRVERLFSSDVFAVEHHVRVDIKDTGGTWRDMTDLVDQDFVTSIEYGESLNQPGIDGSVQVYVEHFEDRLSPFSDSRLSGIIDAWREIRIWIAVTALGETPESSDYDIAVTGRIDNYDLSGNPGTIQFRESIFAELQSDFVESVTRYGADDGSKSIADVAQDIIDDWYTYGNLQLQVIDSTTFEVGDYNQTKTRVLKALQDLVVASIGFDIRPRWNDSFNKYMLELYEPDRSSTTVDLAIPVEFIESYSRLSVDIKNIRNVVRVYYRDRNDTNASGEAKIKSVTKSNTSSINAYGRRYMELSGDTTNLIGTSAEANTLADAALNDLSTPTVEASVILTRVAYWIQLNDIIELPADGEKFSNTETLAVVGYSHSIDAGRATTQFEVRGQPIASNKNWTNIEGSPGKNAIVDDLEPRQPTMTVVPDATGVQVTTNVPPNDRDWDAVEVHTSQASGFSPDETTLDQWARTSKVSVGPYPAWDPDTQSDETFYILSLFRDREGNYGDPSDQDSFTPVGIDNEHLSAFLRLNFSYRVNAQYTENTSGSKIEFTKPRYSHSLSKDGWSTTAFEWTNIDPGVFEIDVHVKLAADTGFNEAYVRIRIEDDAGNTIQTYVGNRVGGNVDSSMLYVTHLFAGTSGSPETVTFEIVFDSGSVDIEPDESYFSITSQPGPTS